MTVGELKIFLEGIPDDVGIFVDGGGHSWRRARVYEGTVLQDGSYHYTTDFGEATTSEAGIGKRLKALLMV
jgi:hypothetical protein